MTRVRIHWDAARRPRMAAQILLGLWVAGATACGGETAVEPSPESLKASFAARIEGIASVAALRREGDQLTFTHPNSDGDDVGWLVTIESVRLDPPPEEAVPDRGYVVSSWYADGERIEPLGSMSRLPDDIWQRGIAQECYALWVAEEGRWDW